MPTPNDGADARGLSQDALVERVLAILAEVAGAEASAAVTPESFRGQSSVRLPAEQLREHLLDRLEQAGS